MGGGKNEEMRKNNNSIEIWSGRLYVVRKEVDPLAPYPVTKSFALLNPDNDDDGRPRHIRHLRAFLSSSSSEFPAGPWRPRASFVAFSYPSNNPFPLLRSSLCVYPVSSIFQLFIMLSISRCSVLAAFLVTFSAMMFPGSESFSIPATSAVPSRSYSTTRLQEGRLETIEFKIFPEGRVQEVVRGVKGGNCHSVTEQINEALGHVYETAPTEEMYEQEIVIENTNTLTNSVSDESAASSSSWEGKSSW